MAIEFLKNKTHVSQTIFILIILYAMSSFFILGLAWGIFPFLPGAYLNPNVCVAYAMISFALTAFISAFHLSTMIRRRKRKDDFTDE